MSVFTQHLSQRFQTFAPDLRGYGRSRVRHPFPMEAHLTDLETLLDQYRVERCLVLGWSLGGILALELALRCPERLSGLILIASAACPRSNHPPLSWQDYLFTGLASLSNWVTPGSPWVIETLGKRSLYRFLVQQHRVTTYRYLAAEALPAYLGTSHFATEALQKAIGAGYNRLVDLTEIQHPCLIMAGEHDRHITSASSLETARHLSNSQWRCYSNTAHLFPWEIPQQVLENIDTWLRRYPEVTKKY